MIIVFDIMTLISRLAIFLVFMLAAAHAFMAPHPWIKPSASDSRSPCPALNALANHGFLPRDGRGLTEQMLVDQLVAVFNTDPSLSRTLAKTAISGVSVDGKTLQLSQLQKHGFIEHDASLVHNDTYLGDNWLVDPTLVNDMLNFARKKDNTFGTTELAHFRRRRERQCASQNPEFKFGAKELATAYAEAALLLAVLETTTNERHRMSADAVCSLLGEEKLPEGYQPPSKRIGFGKLLYLGGIIYAKSRLIFSGETGH